MDSRWINGSGTDIDRVEFGYTEASNRQWRQNIVAGTGQDEFYTYDGLYQLTDLQRGTLNSGKTGITGTPAWEEDFTYDPLGNWQSYQAEVSGTVNLAQTRTQNKANEIGSITNTTGPTVPSVGYDHAGNMTAAPEPANWGDAFAQIYDAWNRLVEVTTGTGGSLLTVAVYAYDGLTRRVTKTTGAGTQDYYYSNTWQVLEISLEGSSTEISQFVWGLRSVDDLVQRKLTIGSIATIHYAMRDRMHVTSISDTSADVLERYGYNAFGTTLFMNASFASISGSAYMWDTTFCSYLLDDETGFYQVRNRYLHPTLGRWLSRDPAGETAGTNLYHYVQNRPSTLLDPSGLDCTPGDQFGGFPGGLTDDESGDDGGDGGDGGNSGNPPPGPDGPPLVSGAGSGSLNPAGPGGSVLVQRK